MPCHAVATKRLAGERALARKQHRGVGDGRKKKECAAAGKIKADFVGLEGGSSDDSIGMVSDGFCGGEEEAAREGGNGAEIGNKSEKRLYYNDDDGDYDDDNDDDDGGDDDGADDDDDGADDDDGDSDNVEYQDDTRKLCGESTTGIKADVLTLDSIDSYGEVRRDVGTAGASELSALDIGSSGGRLVSLPGRRERATIRSSSSSRDRNRERKISRMDERVAVHPVNLAETVLAKMESGPHPEATRGERWLKSKTTKDDRGVCVCGNRVG